jgi:fluoride ion exporter CrcB/FEX
MCRYIGMTMISRFLGECFPWGTLVVNAFGSFLLGLALGGGIPTGGDWHAFAGDRVLWGLDHIFHL